MLLVDGASRHGRGNGHRKFVERSALAASQRIPKPCCPHVSTDFAKNVSNILPISDFDDADCSKEWNGIRSGRFTVSGTYWACAYYTARYIWIRTQLMPASCSACERLDNLRKDGSSAWSFATKNNVACLVIQY